MFLRVYRLEIQSVMLVYSTQLCEPLPLKPSLWFYSPPSPLFSLCEEVYHIHYTRIQCVRAGAYEVLGLRQIDTCRKVPLQVNFFG
jgi:hypothetical protein